MPTIRTVARVGLYPEPHRESDWLNPEMLYRAHDQDVRLIFEPT